MISHRSDHRSRALRHIHGARDKNHSRPGSLSRIFSSEILYKMERT